MTSLSHGASCAARQKKGEFPLPHRNGLSHLSVNAAGLSHHVPQYAAIKPAANRIARKTQHIGDNACGFDFLLGDAIIQMGQRGNFTVLYTDIHPPARQAAVYLRRTLRK